MKKFKIKKGDFLKNENLLFSCCFKRQKGWKRSQHGGFFARNHHQKRAFFHGDDGLIGCDFIADT